MEERFSIIKSLLSLLNLTKTLQIHSPNIFPNVVEDEFKLT